jgi:hypothetical protein
MQPAATPRPRDGAEARAHLRANVDAARAIDRHPGHWQQHTWAVPSSPGDFTPVKAPEYAELHDGLPVLGELLEVLGGILGPGDAQAVTKRAPEAGQ